MSPHASDSPRDYSCFSPYVARLIRYKAKTLAVQRRIRWDEVPDVEQTLATHVVEKIPLHDPARGSMDTFCNRIVENRLRSYLEERRAEKRDPGRCRRSLDDPILDDGDDSLALGATLDGERGVLGDGPTYRGVERWRDLEMDFGRFRETLPPTERELFDRLQRMNLADAARELGKPRTSLNRVVDRLRRRLELAHLAPESRNSPRHSAARPGR